jgi:hypothetical protein
MKYNTPTLRPLGSLAELTLGQGGSVMDGQSTSNNGKPKKP